MLAHHTHTIFLIFIKSFRSLAIAFGVSGWRKKKQQRQQWIEIQTTRITYERKNETKVIVLNGFNRRKLESIYHTPCAHINWRKGHFHSQKRFKRQCYNSKQRMSVYCLICTLIFSDVVSLKYKINCSRQ